MTLFKPYAPAAKAAKIASDILIVPWEIIYAQFAGETGFFHNSRSRVYNYGSFMPPGRTEFASPEDFAEYFTKQIQRNYPKAIGAKTVVDYVAGLTKGRIGTYYAGPSADGSEETAEKYTKLLIACLPPGCEHLAMAQTDSDDD